MGGMKLLKEIQALNSCECFFSVSSLHFDFELIKQFPTLRIHNAVFFKMKHVLIS